MDIEGLVLRVKEKDEKSLNDLVLRSTPLIRYIISPILPSPQDREECLSDIALTIWEKIDMYDPALGSFNAWLTSVARNRALNMLRKSRQADTQGELSEDIASTQPGPHEKLLEKERKEALTRALNTLSDKDRNLFYRKYYYMQSTAQISAECGLSERAVEGKLYRIKKRLKKQLGGDEND